MANEGEKQNGARAEETAQTEKIRAHSGKTSGNDDLIPKVITAENESVLTLLRLIQNDVLIEVLKRESARTVAAILCCLPEEQAAAVLAGLDEGMRGEAALEIARGEKTSRAVMEAMAGDIMEKAGRFTSEYYIKLGGIGFAGSVLSRMPKKAREETIAGMEGRDAALCGEVRRRVFAFDDIARLNDRTVQKLLRKIDTRELAGALKGADEDVREKIFHNMSGRAAAMLKEEMEFMGPTWERTVEECREHIVGVALRLADSGEIVLFTQDDDALVL